MPIDSRAGARRLAVVGAGYVGLVTAVGLARLGHIVSIRERDRVKARALAGGSVPFFEPGLTSAYAEVLRDGRVMLDGPDAHVEAILICVGTPIQMDGSSDLTQLSDALSEAGSGADVPIVIRSTLPPGGTRFVLAKSGIRESRVITNPEFLRQGTALNDFEHPARMVFGRFRNVDESALALVISLFEGIEAPRLIVDVASAELMKNAANAFLALKLSFTNEISSLAEEYGADIDEVLRGLALDPRIGSQYMRPSFGFGGSCLPKELRAVAAAGEARGLPMHVTRAASDANASSTRRFHDQIAAATGGLDGRRVGLLGLAFKADTDDVRDSPAVRLARLMTDAGAVVRAFDPRAGANAKRSLPSLAIADNAADALKDADAAVIATEWPEFRALDWRSLGATMRRRLVLDGRRLLDGDALRGLGFEYQTIGRGERLSEDPSSA
jgi:UDPglucose 6-dehydrogenase